MRAGIVAFDTRGGVEPYVALAAGLRAAGHEVRLVAPEDAVPMAEAAGVPIAVLTGSVAGFLQQTRGATERGTLAAQRLAVREMGSRIEGWTTEALAGLEGAEIALGGIGGMVVGLAPAEKLGIPFVPAHLQPVGAPTGAYRGVLIGTPGWLGAPGRVLGHRLSETAFWMPFRGAMSAARARLGVDGRKPATEGQPTLYGFSRHVVPVPEGDPARYVTGYWRLAPAAGWQPPDDLAAFVAGPGPVVSVGFGSMVSDDPDAMRALVREALERARVRGVLVAGWNRLDDGDAAADERLRTVGSIPYGWLFPRVAAVAHHGGAGTTGEGIRAGVPSIIVPFGVDQPFWGSRVRDLGVGPAPIPRKRLTADRLAAAISQAIGDEPMRARAAALGAQVRAEDGVAAAVAVLERLASTGPDASHRARP